MHLSGRKLKEMADAAKSDPLYVHVHVDVRMFIFQAILLPAESLENCLLVDCCHCKSAMIMRDIYNYIRMYTY